MTLIFCVALAASAAALPSPPPRENWPALLRSAIEQAVTQNPEVASMEARIEASRRRVAQSTALPDPELEVGIKDIPPSSLSLSRDDFTMEMIAARQRFPAFGKRAADERAAAAELSGARVDHVRHVVEIAADVTDAFFRLAEVDRRLAILVETRARLSDAVISARERYRVGKGAQADVLRADLEKTALEDRLASLKSARRTEAARWNALQNLRPSAPVPPIAFSGNPEAAVLPEPLPPVEALLERAEKESPLLLAAQAQIRRAQAGVDQARLERRPEWMLSSYYGRREKFEDLAGLSVSISLPWVHPRRLEERQAERRAELEAASADLATARNLLRRDLEQAYAELERNREQAALYRDAIVPEAQVNDRAAREGYAVGAIDFLTYVRAAIDLDTYEGDLAEREAGVGQALAALQRASGIPLIAGTPGREAAHEKE